MPAVTPRGTGALLAAGAASLILAACGGGGDGSGKGGAKPGTGTPAIGGKQPVTVTHGVTSVSIPSGTARLLDLAGVEIAPTGAARKAGARYRLPVTGGRIQGTPLKGTVRHSGGLRFTAGGRSVVARDLIVNFDRDVVTAEVDGKRVPLLGLDPGRPRKVPVTRSVVIPATASIVPKSALNSAAAQLGVGSLPTGLPLAHLEVTAAA